MNRRDFAKNELPFILDKVDLYTLSTALRSNAAGA
jgi:hypothetical protein